MVISLQTVVEFHGVSGEMQLIIILQWTYSEQFLILCNATCMNEWKQKSEAFSVFKKNLLGQYSINLSENYFCVRILV